MKPEDAAWLAGYIDGDGCICLGKRGGRKFRSVRIVIDSADREILEYVMVLAGGTLIEKPKAAEHHRQCWSWRLCGIGKIKDLLKVVSPYLRCAAKKRRAEMILTEWSGCTPRNGYYTLATTALKEDFETRFMAIGAGRGKRNQPLAA